MRIFSRELCSRYTESSNMAMLMLKIGLGRLYGIHTITSADD